MGLSGHISGSTTVGPAIAYANAETPTVASSGSYSVGNSQTLSLGSGMFVYSNISMAGAGTIQFSGPAVLYVTGGLTMGNNAIIRAYNNEPRNLQMRVVGPGSVTLGGAANVYGKVYCPQSTFQVGNNGKLHGSVIAKQFISGGATTLHDDQTEQWAASTSASASRISLVR